MFATVPDFTNTTMCSDRLKMTSTGDRISFRALYSNEYISFVPGYSTVIGCNFMPRFTVYDGGIRRRLVVVPFRVSFSPNPRSGEIFKKSDPLVRENFRHNCSWRDDYIVNLIHSSRRERLIDATNNRFLAFLFEKYSINDDSNEKYKLDDIISEYRAYLSELDVKCAVSKPRIEELLFSFDIKYDAVTSTVENLRKLQ
jgi:phage/plasmid-associated DNA primase